MIYEILAYAVFSVHLFLSGFVPFGGFLVLRWPRIAWAHIPFAAWGILVNFADGTCPLTPLEVSLLKAAGKRGYDSGFIERHLFPLINFDNAQSRDIEISAGLLVLTLNLIAYSLVVWRRRRRRLLHTPARP